jgi:hypothetical protein
MLAAVWAVASKTVWFASNSFNEFSKGNYGVHMQQF